MSPSENLNSFPQTVFNVVTTLVGVGVVGLPHAVAQAGWVCGLGLVTIATGLAIYCGTLLAACMNDGVPGQRFTKYTSLGEYAWGIFGLGLGWYASIGSCLAASIFFIVAGIEQFEVLFPNVPFKAAEWASIFFILVLPLCYLKTLGHAGAVSFLGAMTSIYTMLMVTVLVLYDYMSGKTKGLDTRTSLGPPRGVGMLCNSMVTIIFSLGGMCVFPEVSRCMAQPEYFGRAIFVACSVTYLFYIALVVSAYGLFGEHLLEDPGYANVLKMLSNNWLAKTVALSILLHIVAAFVVTIMPVFRAIEDHFEANGKPLGTALRIGERTLVAGFCLLVAVAVPFFGDIMALVGASMDSLSGVILPCFFFVTLFYFRDPLGRAPADEERITLLVNSKMASPQEVERHIRMRPGWRQVVVTLAIGCTMVVIAITGSYRATLNIAEKWKEYVHSSV